MTDCPTCDIPLGPPYDIGNGREAACSSCDCCFALDGQELDPLQPLKLYNKLLAEHPEHFPSWARPLDVSDKAITRGRHVPAPREP